VEEIAVSRNIVRTAQGVTVTLWGDAWPRQCSVTIDGKSGSLDLFTTAQIRGLHWALGEVINADPQPDTASTP
jgi:hypothetical protein